MNDIDINKIPKSVKIILHTLKKLGFEAYLCGGAVRDLLLGKEPKDFDICTSATPLIIKALFPKTIDIGLKHGTVTVLLGDEAIEVTTFRSDGDYTDGRRPDEVTFSQDPQTDVNRRDFTINGLLFDGKEVIDYCDGLVELKAKKIKAIRNPIDRFSEDALRMMRAIRFACQLEFEIEFQTFYAIKCCKRLIVNVSKERIRDELCKILMCNNPSKGIDLLQQTGLLSIILPELEACVDFDQHNPNHFKDVYKHTMKVLDSTPNNLHCRLSALLHDIGKPNTFSMDENGVGHFYGHHVEGAYIAKSILERLKFDNDTIERVSILVKEHMSRFPKVRSATMKRLIARVGKDNLDNLINLQIADIIGSKPPYDFSFIVAFQNEIKRILEAKEPFSRKDLAINGKDIIDCGIAEGKEVGRILDILLNLVLDHPEMNEKDVLLLLVKDKKYLDLA